MTDSTLPTPVASSARAYYGNQYSIARSRFQSLVDEYRRTTSTGKDFILVSEVTRRLLKKSESSDHRHNDDLEHLRITGHHRHFKSPPSFQASHIDEYQSVFYTLVDIDCPHLIDQFLKRGINDWLLPASLDVLQKNIETDETDFHKRFLREQYRWCPLMFDLKMNHSSSTSDRIVPLCLKEKIEPRRGICTRPEHISTLWKVEVPEELVTRKLRDRIEHSRVQRDVEGPGNEIVTV